MILADLMLRNWNWIFITKGFNNKNFVDLEQKVLKFVKIYGLFKLFENICC